jgi:hypothetical protein
MKLICESCLQFSPCGCMRPKPTPFGPDNELHRHFLIRRLLRVIRSFFRFHLLAVAAAALVLVSQGATPLSGGEFDSYVSRNEAAFVRACYLTTGASLRGNETVSSILTVLYIGRWWGLTQSQQIELFRLIERVKRRALETRR